MTPGAAPPFEGPAHPAPHTPRARLVAGVMTGTSLDGLDAAWVEVRGQGLALRAAVLRHVSHPLGAWADDLRRLARGEALNAGAICAAAQRLSQAHVLALRELSAGEIPDLIAIHGQTLYHAPPLSWQLAQPAGIAAALSAPVVFDLRAADLAAGGQGAPITPLADYVLFGDRDERRCVVNLGGFCNVTRLPRRSGESDHGPAELDSIEGGDVCACNQLLDRVARERLGTAFDDRGQAALAGMRNPAAENELSALLEAQASAGRSLGTGDELGDWTARWGDRLSAKDLARSACEAIASVVARRTAPAERVVLAGGGMRNAALVNALQSRIRTPVSPADDLGVPASHREAAAMAVLGALCADGVPITLPQITGVPSPAPRAGAWAVAPLPRA